MTSAADIAPSLTVYKPKPLNAAVYTRPNASRRSKKKPLLKPIKEIEQLTFEWKDLPPIEKLKSAIVRRKVSDGISYMLPIDKGKISINNHFRTDLRYMFQEPYSEKMVTYDESKVRATAKIHFDHNSCQTRVTRNEIETGHKVELNSDSNKVFLDFSRSTPKTGGHGNRFQVSPEKMEKRSSLFIPVKAFVPPEAQKMRDEAQKILDSVDEIHREDDSKMVEEKIPDTRKRRQSKSAIVTKPRKSVTVSLSPHGKGDPPVTTKFTSYDELKSFPVPPIPDLPEVLNKSVHITPSKAKEIWQWLHDGEALSEFDYFLSICA